MLLFNYKEFNNILQIYRQIWLYTIHKMWNCTFLHEYTHLWTYDLPAVYNHRPNCVRGLNMRSNMSDEVKYDVMLHIGLEIQPAQKVEVFHSSGLTSLHDRTY